MLKIGSLCTGYGGLDMAVEAYFNAETVWTCEYDKHASKVIDKQINKPNYGDIKTTDWATVEPIDILTAGYPCQPFSHAGLRKGADDERHLWPYIKEIIRTLRPSYVILENVRGHFKLGFPEVLGDLTSIGYDAKWKIVRASDVGAPHRRERLFIVAYPQLTNPNSLGCSLVEHESGAQRDKGQPQFELEYVGQQIITDTDNAGRFGNSQGSQGRFNSRAFTNTDCDARTQPRRANREIPAESIGLPRGQNERQTGTEFRRSVTTVTDSYGDEQPRNGAVSGLGSRFNSRAEMCLQTPADPLVDGKLNPKFVEYMMGLPEGWVTDCDISRAQQLKILGNGVVPQQAYKALELLVNNL